MKAQWLDWLVVGIVVAGAALWLGMHYRRKWLQKKAQGTSPGACGGGCDGCRYSKDCSRKID
jgi:FeoB-associated Cys-rich membrane protein